ncbi:tetratricopeptide repeat protein [Phormidium sp. CCY1219]|uniref:tetratricopeptide repeat protein n=1 Tax=Phormidium sp. CCY1219 TaxID=2886104 RepID=UPI002D1EFDB3|nr:tetratricopeptide repeat protein [Phormidium sp. CCY1219]MEB3830724.1 tetratricopeptide repeat protein [Phormidium sp. CCY1219]
MVDLHGVEFWLQQGQERQAARQWEAAIACYREALNRDPNKPTVRRLLAEVYTLQGDFPEAIAQCQTALKLAPDFAEAYKTLGNALSNMGNLPAAQRAYSRAVEIMPDFAAAHANLGSALYRQGQLEEAIACYKNAIAAQPTLAGVHWNLGQIYSDLGRFAQALASWQQALALQPQMAGFQSYLKLGNGLLELERLDEAISSYHRAIALQPDSAEAYSNLSTALAKQNRLDEAVAFLNRAIALNPTLPGLHFNLGKTLLQQFPNTHPLIHPRFDSIVESFLTAISLQPDFVAAHQSLFNLLTSPPEAVEHFSRLRTASERYLTRCSTPYKIIAAIPALTNALHAGRNEFAAETFRQLETQIAAGFDDFSQNFIKNLYGHLLYAQPHLRDDRSRNFQLSQLLGKATAEQLDRELQNHPPATPATTFRPKSPSQPLKIGFISPHFRRHSVGWCSADILRALSEISPQIYLYVTHSQKVDDKTEHFQKTAAKFYPFPQDSDNSKLQILEQILQDELDILVDLDSLTFLPNLEILYRAPAPVCVSWLGFDAPFMSEKNYYLSDWHTHPEGIEPHYCEQLVRMPNSFVAVSGFAREAIDTEAARQRMGIDSQQVVYLCVAPGKKLDRQMVRAQIQILDRVPNSILLHKGQGDPAVIREAYDRACLASGVARARVKCVGRSPTEEAHRPIYSIADVLLDSYPYNGGTHNLEALWFNLPIVTRTGEQSLSRMGYSFLKTLGIEAGIAWSWDDYIAWGIRLGKDASLRWDIKQRLIHSKQPEALSPLWNPKQFARDMYEIFEQLRNRL